MSSTRDYFRGLNEYVGGSWNRFWFEAGDAFGIGVLRIAIGLMALIWQLSFTPELVNWFGNTGWLVEPVVGGVLLDPTGYRLSFLNFDDSPTMLWVLHVFSSLVLLAFTIGFMARLTSILSLIVVLAYAHRALIVAGPADPVLTMLVLYMCLAPSGTFLSVDAKIRPRTREVPTFSLWATLSRRLIQVHLVIIYIAMGTSALASETWWYGEALWWISAQPEGRLVDLSFLRGFVPLLHAATHLVLICTFAFIIFVWNDWLRPIVLSASILMWVFLALITGNLGLSAVMIIANLAFVPSAFWRSLWKPSELENVTVNNASQA